MYYIYWIRIKEHTDYVTEGYIGFSNNPQRRFEEHSSAKNKKSKLYNHIRKHEEEIIFDILFSFDSKENALQKEKELRPRKNIGWNIAIGGQCPPEIRGDQSVADKISITIKKKMDSGEIAIPDIKKLHTKEAKEKRKQVLKAKNKKVFYNPENLEYRNFDTGLGDLPPVDWLPGRKPKQITQKKLNPKCNVWCWEVYKNNNLIWAGENIKIWSKENCVGLNYSKAIIKKIKEVKTFIIEKSQNNTIVVNGLDTCLIPKDWAFHIDRSESWVSSTIRNGSYKEVEYDVYTTKKIKQARTE